MQAKHYQALIDSGAAISLIRHSTYKQIDDHYKTPIQSTAAKLNTVDGSPMTTLGSTALHLCIADFTFTHNFIVCDQLPDKEFILGMDIQRKFFNVLCLGQGSSMLHTEEWKILIVHACDTSKGHNWNC